METASLIQALKLESEKHPAVAIVGGGGKTSLIFRLTEEFV